MSITAYPSRNTWITPRTIEKKMTDQNCELILPQKIDSIQRILLDATNISARIHAGDGSVDARLGILTLGNGEKLSTLDITKFVVEKAKYYTLSIKGLNIITSDKKDLFKDNTWYYEHNSQSIRLINENYGADKITDPVFYNLIAGAVLSINNVMTPNGYPVLNIEMPPNPSSILSAKFRIYYTPLGESVKLQVPKTNPQVNQFCIPYSQQQPIVDNVTLGREMQSVANRVGCEKKEVVRTCHSFSEVRKLGTIWREKYANGDPTGDIWRLTAQNINIYSETHIVVTETWSKNWSYRSENVPINREFRSWNIPADIVQRNLLWQDYCLISRKDLSDSEFPDTSILSGDAKLELMRGLDDSFSGQPTECNNMWFYRKVNDNNYTGAVLSCSTFGFGNSLVFSGKTKDNLSAGVQREESKNNGKYEFCKDVYYCNEDGTLDTMFVQCGTEMSNFDSYLYPEFYSKIIKVDNKDILVSLNRPAGLCLFNAKTFEVFKDPCEQLNFTYQLHLLTDDGQLVIGSTWAASNPLVKERDKAPTLKVWKLTQPLPQGAQVMTTSYGTELQSSDLFNAVLSNYTITFNPEGTTNDGVGVCVTDEKDNVLIAYNSNEPATFFVKFTHDYDAIAKALKNN